jgi:subtilisin family serine protease
MFTIHRISGRLRLVFQALIIGVFVATSASSATGQVLNQGPEYVSGRYIVIFHDRPELAQRTVSEMAVSKGMKITHVYDGEEHPFGFAGEFDDQSVARLRLDPRVAHIEQDQIVRVHAKPIVPSKSGRLNEQASTRGLIVRPKPKGTPVIPPQTISWGMVRINAASSSAKSGDGSGSVNVDVAVIDTGIDLKHPDLKLMGGRNFTSGGFGNYGDGYGHGTHVAGIIGALDNSFGVVGVAPGARLWSVRVMDNTGTGLMSGVIAGVNYVTSIAKTIEIANMSLGGSESKALSLAMDKAIAAGITFVVASGNESTDCRTSSPANSLNKGLITVSGMNQDGSFASYSNYGRNFLDDSGAENGVDVIAPGTNIYSTYKAGTYSTLSGSSMATAHATGVAALCKVANPSFKPHQIRNSVMKSAPAGFLGYNGLALFGITPWSATIGDPDGFYEPLINAGAY